MGHFVLSLISTRASFCSQRSFHLERYQQWRSPRIILHTIKPTKITGMEPSVIKFWRSLIQKERKIGESNNPRHLPMNDSQWSELLANDEVERMREFVIKLPD